MAPEFYLVYAGFISGLQFSEKVLEKIVSAFVRNLRLGVQHVEPEFFLVKSRCFSSFAQKFGGAIAPLNPL